MFLIQHGFQKGTKIADAVRAGTAGGVIWSPGDEAPTSLSGSMADPALAGSHQLIDPQLYVASLASPSLKKLPDYPYFLSNLQPRHFNAARTVELVQKTLDFQQALPVSHVIAPTVPVTSVNDRWSQVAASLADASLSDWSRRGDQRPLIVSCAVTTALLSNELEVNALLNELTAIDTYGFYLLFEIDPDSDPTKQDDLLERSLWITYSLAELNDYAVTVGYAGLSGFAYRAAGADAFAAGWWRKLQSWSPSHWLASGGGGRQPRARIELRPLLGSLLLESELEAIRRADAALYTDLLSVGPLAAKLRNSTPLSPPAPSRDELAAQLFAVCHALDQRMSGPFPARARTVLDDIADAADVHRRIRGLGVNLEIGSSARRITAWQSALFGLGRRVGVTL